MVNFEDKYPNFMSTHRIKKLSQHRSSSGNVKGPWCKSVTVPSPCIVKFREVPLTALKVFDLPYWPSPDLMWCPRYLNNKLLVKLYSFPDKKLKRTNKWFCRKLTQKLVHIGANMNNFIFWKSEMYTTLSSFPCCNIEAGTHISK